MTFLQASTPSSESSSWHALEKTPPLDDLDVELSDDDLEQVAGGLTRAWNATLGPRNNTTPTTIQTDEGSAL